MKLKLNRANNLLVKIRYHVDSKLLKRIYSAIFESDLRYGYQLWGQTQTQVKITRKNSKQSTPNNQL